MFEVVHAKLGELIYEDEGWWKGKTEINKLKLEFFVDGNEFGVNENLAEECFEVLKNFEEFKQKAMRFLEEKKIRLNIKQELEFIPTGIWSFCREKNTKSFTMEFNEKSKPEFLWRVEFENSEAKYAGFDS